MSKRKTKFRVELHCHLDGSARPQTLYELSVEKNLPLPGDGSYEAYLAAVTATEPTNLQDFLSHLTYVTPAMYGDPAAMERIAYELSEDKANDGLLYVETRYSPHLLADDTKNVTARDIVIAVNRGLQRGETDFGVKMRSILCCIRGHPEFSMNIVELSNEFKEDGVVGIDIAGVVDNQEIISQADILAFQEAKRIGIHRTAHAGEAGPASSVKLHVDSLDAERIGHGYHVLESDSIYNEMKSINMHFETCPHSSILTGAVPQDAVHPIVRFSEDGVSFSLSTDDMTVTGTNLTYDYVMAWNMNLIESQLVKANFDAAQVSFLPEAEKQQLIEDLKKVIGVPQ